MDNSDYMPEALARITVDPGKRSGQPTIRGLRITVRDILEYLAGGMFQQEILDEFPELEREDFQAVYAYASSTSRGQRELAPKIEKPKVPIRTALFPF